MKFIIITSHMGTVDDEISSVEVEEEQQTAVDLPADTDSSSDPPNIEIVQIVEEKRKAKLELKSSKFKLWSCLLWLNMYFNIRYCALAFFICISATIGILVVCLTAVKQTVSTCPLTFTSMLPNLDNQNSQPQSVAIGDFNNDTILDIVVANSNTDNIGVYLGNGNGTFGSQTTYSTVIGSHPYSVAVADFNNDHRLDIVVTNYDTHTIDIFLGYGNGNFTIQTTFSTEVSRPLAITVGHFNNDENLDLAVVNYGTHSVDVFLGQDNANFATKTTYSTGYDSYPFALALGDFNRDEYLDIVVANYGTDNIGLFLGKGNGSFANQITYSTGSGSRPSSIVVGDFNGDNKTDVIVANSGTGSISLFLGTGIGTFEKNEMFVTDIFGLLHIVAGDFNNDDRLDIAIANNQDYNIYMILGDGNGSFLNQRIYSTGFGSYPSSLSVGDFNGDGRLDIVVTNNGTNNIGIFLGYDPGLFESPNLYSTGQSSNPKSIVAGDFNNDKKMDIVVGNNKAGNIGVFLGLGDGTFTNQTAYSTGADSFPSSVASGDFNNDNKMDIVVTTDKANNVTIFFGNGDGTFTDIITLSTGDGSSPQSVAVGDFNNDHLLDMVFGKFGYENIGVFLSYGNGSFANQTIYVTEGISNPESVFVADMNNDNQSDVIVVDSSSNNFNIFYGFGNGTFRNPTMYSSTYGFSATSLAVADFNRDGQLDIVIAYYLSDNIGIFLGNGNETFRTETMYSNDVYSEPYSVSIGDLNNDHILDIIVANYITNNFGIFHGFADGTFADQILYSTGDNSGPWALAVGHFNNNNRFDVVVTYAVSDNIAVILGYDYGIVQNQITYTTGAASQPVSVAVADFNHDGWLDIALANYGTESVDIRLGYSNGTFSNEKTYSTGSGSLPISIALGDFNNDAELDIATANFGSDSISVFYGHGDGTFAIKTTRSTGLNSRPSSLAIGDFNNDIWPDIVVANKETNNIGVFLGYKYTAFAEQTTYSIAILSHPLSIVIADFNNDNHQDIVVSTDGQASGNLFLGYGNGTFAQAIIFSTATFREAQLIAFGYLNNDQCLDIVTVNVFQSLFSIFIGDCTGYFENLAIYSTGNQSYPTAIVIGDFNNDNVSDIAVATAIADSISVYLNYGNATFVNQTIYSTGPGSSPNALATGDFNNDKQLDIAVTNYYSSNVGIFFGDGNGSFENQTTYSTGSGSNPNMIALGDFNNDTWLDILIIDAVNNNIGVLLAVGNGTFSEKVKYSVSLIDIPSSVAVHDFNNDHHLDVAVTSSYSGTLRVYFGNDDGTFEIGTMYTTGNQSSPLSLAVGDFNDDNQQDIAVANYGTSNVGVFLGYCCEPFVSQTTFSTGNNSSPSSVAVGDLNNDTRIDIVVANYGIDSIGVFLGYANGTFSNQTLFSTGNGSNPISVAVGDIDGDHHLDIVVANYDKASIGVLLGYGNGTFASIITHYLGSGSRPASVSVSDLNGDNRLDVIVSDDGTNNVIILYGYGNGTFGKTTSFATGYDSQPFSIAAGDFDNDTIQDIVVTLAGTSNIGFISKLC